MQNCIIKETDTLKAQNSVPSSNLLVEAAACFRKSSGSKEINKGVGGFILLKWSIAAINRSATLKHKILSMVSFLKVKTDRGANL